MKIKNIIKIVALVALFLITLALGAKNPQLVTFDYIIAKSELTLSGLLGLTFLLAFLITSLLFSILHFKNKWKIIRLNNQLTKVKAELDEVQGKQKTLQKSKEVQEQLDPEQPTALAEPPKQIKQKEDVDEKALIEEKEADPKLLSSKEASSKEA